MANRTEETTTPTLRQDLATLVKLRLNIFVLITTLFGFILASKGSGIDVWRLINTLIGTAAAAFGSAAFNQLMEIELDARMARTANRPLPARRMDPMHAFVIGWLLSAFGIIHLAVTVSQLAAYLAAATIAIYIFVYTPLKRRSSANTLVGAIPGAIPPVIGWVAAGRPIGIEAWFLFAILFFWQLPHFVAINWLCREEYQQAGFKMWSDNDLSGKRSGLIAAAFAVCLALVSLLPLAGNFTSALWLVLGPLFALAMAALALKFTRDGQRTSARRLFFSTLLYLPVAFTTLTIAWRNA